MTDNQSEEVASVVFVPVINSEARLQPYENLTEVYIFVLPLFSVAREISALTINIIFFDLNWI